MALSKHCNLSKPLSVPALSSDHNPVVFKIILRFCISEARSICNYTHPDRSLYRSILDQLMVINLRIRERTYLVHTIQEFSSAVPHAVSHPFPEFTFQCHRITLPPSLILLSKFKKYFRRRYKRSRFRLVHFCTKFSPVISLPG
jgi:hypothetical protein